LGASEAVVRDTLSGKLLATVPAPAGRRFVAIAAASDDRTFVVGAYNASGGLQTNWYLIRLTPGSAPFATLRKVPISQTYVSYGTMAMSPNGTELAWLSAGVLKVYSTATGALLHDWSTPVGANVLSWTSDGRRLVLETKNNTRSGMLVGIWMSAIDRPGSNLMADSRLLWSVKVPNDPDVGVSMRFPTTRRPLGCNSPDANLITLAPLLSVLVSGDGTTVACGASGVFRDPGNLGDATCPAIPAWNDEGILQYSAATGKLAGTLYRGESNCVPPASPAQLLWISDSGNAVLGYFVFDGYGRQSQPVIRFGLFTAGKFTPLPAPPTITTDPADTAW
jgi:hypothetical protein